MRRPPQDRPAPLRSGIPQPGLAAATFAVLLRRRRGDPGGVTARVVGLSGLTGLPVTAAVLALAWPVFTRMRTQRIWYHHAVAPNLHDHTGLALVALGAARAPSLPASPRRRQRGPAGGVLPGCRGGVSGPGRDSPGKPLMGPGARTAGTGARRVCCVA